MVAVLLGIMPSARSAKDNPSLQTLEGANSAYMYDAIHLLCLAVATEVKETNGGLKYVTGVALLCSYVTITCANTKPRRPTAG